MRKLDNFVLRLFHKISNAAYRVIGMDNYAIGVSMFILALCTSAIIGYYVIYVIAASETNLKIISTQMDSSYFAIGFSAYISIMAIIFRKPLSGFMQMQYDLGKTKWLHEAYAIFVRWFFIIIYFLSIPIGHWWGMLDMFILGLGLMFLSCPPPDMEERMKKAFKDEF